MSEQANPQLLDTVGDASQMVPTEQPAAQFSTNIVENLMCKNRLQEYAQKSGIPLPLYQTINEGAPHAPRFRSTVFVDGTYITSPNTFPHRKTAEQEVASVALASLTQKIKEEGYPIIREDTVFCKSILNEYAMKMNLEKPTYTTIQQMGLLPLFITSLVFNGVNYTGEAGRNKKEAEQLAARAVILSIFGNSESEIVISEIIKSKFKLYAALHKVKESNNSQNGNTPLAANTGAGFVFPFSNEEEVATTGKGNDNDNALLAVNTGVGFGVPLGNQKGVAITGKGNDNSPLAVNTGICFGFPFGNQKGVAITGVANNVTSTTISEACASQPSKIQAIVQPFHESKKPKWEPSPVAFTPIAFVPPAMEQPLSVGPSSARKRNRRNKKKMKKHRVDAQLPGDVVQVVPLSQVAPCSVAQ